jgi:hypothetical protein
VWNAVRAGNNKRRNGDDAGEDCAQALKERGSGMASRLAGDAVRSKR